MFHFCNHLRYSLPAEGPGLSKALPAVVYKCICVSSEFCFKVCPGVKLFCIGICFFKVPNGCVTVIFFPLSMSNDQLLILPPWRNGYASVLQLIPLYREQIVSCWTPLVYALAEINSRALGCWWVHRSTWVSAANPRYFLTSIRGVPWAALHTICWAGRISAVMWAAAAYSSKEHVFKLQTFSHCRDN